MPYPHFDVKIIHQRSKRQSAVASAAYQSRERLFSEYDQKQKYYSHKSEIVHTEIMLPPHVYMGPAVSQLEKKGIQTNIGNLNRDIKAANSLMQSIRQMVRSLKGWLSGQGLKMRLPKWTLFKWYSKSTMHLTDKFVRSRLSPYRFNPETALL